MTNHQIKLTVGKYEIELRVLTIKAAMFFIQCSKVLIERRKGKDKQWIDESMDR
jgi:hypothetical protein